MTAAGVLGVVAGLVGPVVTDGVAEVRDGLALGVLGSGVALVGSLGVTVGISECCSLGVSVGVGLTVGLAVSVASGVLGSTVGSGTVGSGTVGSGVVGVAVGDALVGVGDGHFLP